MAIDITQLNKVTDAAIKADSPFSIDMPSKEIYERHDAKNVV
jgi:hypothetical protein